jgi:hypothetical protein
MTAVAPNFYIPRREGNGRFVVRARIVPAESEECRRVREVDCELFPRGSGEIRSREDRFRGLQVLPTQHRISFGLVEREQTT